MATDATAVTEMNETDPSPEEGHSPELTELKKKLNEVITQLNILISEA